VADKMKKIEELPDNIHENLY